MKIDSGAAYRQDLMVLQVLYRHPLTHNNNGTIVFDKSRMLYLLIESDIKKIKSCQVLNVTVLDKFILSNSHHSSFNFTPFYIN